MKVLLSAVMISNLMFSSGCSGPSKNSLLRKIGIKETMPAGAPGSDISAISSYDQNRLRSLQIPAAPYYLVTATMSYPLNWYYYESTKDRSIEGSSYLDPPVGQTCFDGDKFKCAKEGKWRLIGSLPCGIELQLIVASFQNNETKYMGGAKVTLSCDRPSENWNFVTN